METQFDGRSARVRLLDAADELFYVNGISRTGVDDLLASAHVSVATLYAQFRSKDGLLQASLERRLEGWRECWDGAISAAQSDEDRLLAVFDALTLYRERQHSVRWCAFLSTAVETRTDHPVSALLAAETTLLNRRLRDLAAPLAGAQAEQLAADILLIYNGTLASLLRGSPADPIARGREIAKAASRSSRTPRTISPG
ncbi:TetR/AcrR family transcriptional regulator [Leifsonia sp. A12D58]|uniref:TetR/AcrR family transcriptional regulator n=1 Tax=Leifsonia sp. A12D58 TaxID=3397674 RepID=UPI0039DF2E8E